MSEELDLEKTDDSRRDFLKKSLVAGAAVWAAPAVASLPGGKAWAQSYTACTCSGSAFGLQVIVSGLGINQQFGVDGCVAGPVTVINTPLIAIAASVVCGTDTSSIGDTCSGDASVATLNVRLGPDPIGPVNAPLLVNSGTIFSNADATCVGACGATGSSTIQFLQLGGALVPGGLQTVVASGCNNDLLGLGLVTFNEQICTGSTLSVNALHIGPITLPVLGTIDIIVAHSEAGAARVGGPPCSCNPCT